MMGNQFMLPHNSQMVPPPFANPLQHQMNGSMESYGAGRFMGTPHMHHSNPSLSGVGNFPIGGFAGGMDYPPTSSYPFM
jgi:hypothetical protein